MNSTRLEDLAKNGKICFRLSDAIVLALENNYDIAIQRYNLDIADTDILRAKSGAGYCLGAPSGLVENTIGGTNSLFRLPAEAGRHFSGAGGDGAGSTGLYLTTNGRDRSPEVLDPTLTGTIQTQRQTHPTTSSFSGFIRRHKSEGTTLPISRDWIPARKCKSVQQ